MAQTTAFVAAIIRIPIAIHGIGIYGFGLSMVIMQSFGILSLATGASRLYTRSLISESHKDEWFSSFSKILSKSISVSIFFQSGAFLILFLVYRSNSLSFLGLGSTDCVMIIALMVLYLGNSLILGAAIGYCDVLGLYNRILLSDIITSVVSIPAVAILVWIEADIAFYIFVFSLTFTFPGIYALILIKKKNPFLFKLQKPDFNFAKSLFLSGGQGLGMVLSTNFDLIIYTGIRGLDQASLFSITSKFAGIINAPSSALAPKQWTTFGRLRLNRVGSEFIKKQLLRYQLVNTSISIVIFVIIGFIAKYGLSYVSNGELTYNLNLYIVMGLTQLALSVYATMFAAFSGEIGKKHAWKISVIIGLVNLLLTISLTFYFGIYGPGIASFIAFSFGAVLFFKSNKSYMEN